MKSPWCLLGVLACTASGFRQGTGTIHRSVTDTTGLAVPNAKVTATLVERATTRTVGTYTITVEAAGAKTFARQSVGFTADQNARVDAPLYVGTVRESVSVTAEAPLVDSPSSVVGTLIDSRRVLELPTNGRRQSHTFPEAGSQKMQEMDGGGIAP